VELKESTRGRWRVTDKPDKKGVNLQKVEQKDCETLEKQANIVIKSPHKIHIPEDDAYHERRDKFFKNPKFAQKIRKKTLQQLMDEEYGRRKNFVEKIKQNKKRLMAGEVPSEVTEAGKKHEFSNRECMEHDLEPF